MGKILTSPALLIAHVAALCSISAIDDDGRSTMPQPILHQVAEGQASAMERFLDAYSGLVWSLARRHSPTPQDAEDAVQEIFLEIWKSAGRYDPDVAAEQTFVAMIARRRLIDRARRARRIPRAGDLSEPEFLPAAVEPDRAEISDEASKVSGVLKTLRPEQQKVLELSLVHGRSHSQISEQLTMPLGTVKSLARRGLMKVRRTLGIDLEAGSTKDAGSGSSGTAPGTGPSSSDQLRTGEATS